VLSTDAGNVNEERLSCPCCLCCRIEHTGDLGRLLIYCSMHKKRDSAVFPAIRMFRRFRSGWNDERVMDGFFLEAHDFREAKAG
jgi:hypothetical protein